MPQTYYQVWDLRFVHRKYKTQLADTMHNKNKSVCILPMFFSLPLAETVFGRRHDIVEESPFYQSLPFFSSSPPLAVSRRLSYIASSTCPGISTLALPARQPKEAVVRMRLDVTPSLLSRHVSLIPHSSRGRERSNSSDVAVRCSSQRHRCASCSS